MARATLELYFAEDDNERPWLFPQLLTISKRWMAECVTCKDDAFPQMLWMGEFKFDAAERIYQSVVRSSEGEKALKPILRPYDTLGSTRYVDFDTTRPVYPTDPAKCHISHVVADTGSWEQKMAQALEEMDEVVCYVKNQGLGFTIPYTLNGEEHQYVPDFIARVKPHPRPLPSGKTPLERGEPRGEGELFNLIIEVSGEARKDKAAKAATARVLWVPAINNHGRFGRWAFVEITDPWDAKNMIRAMLGSVRALI